MATRFGEYVEYGELYNTKNYSTHGTIMLRGEPEEEGDRMFVRFDLTGDCAPDLKGKHIRFQPADEDGTQIDFPREDYLPGMQLQSGVTGTMTAQGWARMLPCTVEEFVNRSSLGEMPPTPWRNHLMLEWFGPKGRMTVEMVGAIVEYCTREPAEDDEEDEGDWETLPNLAPMPDYAMRGEDEADVDSAPQITRFEIRDDEIHVEEMRPLEGTAEETGEDDDFQRILDAETERIDRVIAGLPEKKDPDPLEGHDRIDYCLERGKERPLTSFIDDWRKLPLPDELDDEAVEIALKTLLVRLVMFGIVLDVCKHFTPRDCYRLLLEEILPGEGAFEELVGTGWIQHYCTYEYCKKCDEESEERFKNMEL